MASPPTGDLPHPSVGRGPRAPPESMHLARRDTWIPPYESYCAPFRCRASPTGGRRGGRPCPPEQREALSFRASDRVTGVGIRFPVGRDPCVLPKFDKKPPAVYTRLKDAAINGRRLVTAPRGGDIHVFRGYDSYSGSFDLDTSPTTEKQKPPPWPVTVFVGCKAH